MVIGPERFPHPISGLQPGEEHAHLPAIRAGSHLVAEHVKALAWTKHLCQLRGLQLREDEWRVRGRRAGRVRAVRTFEERAIHRLVNEHACAGGQGQQKHGCGHLRPGRCGQAAGGQGQQKHGCGSTARWAVYPPHPLTHWPDGHRLLAAQTWGGGVVGMGHFNGQAVRHLAGWQAPPASQTRRHAGVCLHQAASYVRAPRRGAGGWPARPRGVQEVHVEDETAGCQERRYSGEEGTI